MVGISFYDVYGDASHNSEENPEFLHIKNMDDRSEFLDDKVAPHAHRDMFQLIFAVEGRCVVNIEGVNHSLSGPCALYIPGGTVHSFDFDEKSVGWVVIGSEHIFSLEVDYRSSSYLSPLLRSPVIKSFDNNLDSANRISWLLEQMLIEFNESKQGWTLSLENLIRLVLIELRRQLDDGISVTTISNVKQETFFRFRKLLENNFRSHWSVGEYSNTLGIGSVGLNKVCEQFTGRTVNELVQSRLTLEAQRLLIYSETSATHISYNLGFQDPAYFNRFFKRRTGMTPLAFRQAEMIAKN